MSFHEKSAWLMTLALVVTGVFYFYIVTQMSGAMGTIAPPLIPIIVVYVIFQAVIAIFGHTIIAILAPKEASAGLDERDRIISARAGSASSYVFATGVVLSLGFYLLTRNGDALFHGVFGSLMLGQTAEYLLQIYFYRRTV